MTHDPYAFDEDFVPSEMGEFTKLVMQEPDRALERLQKIQKAIPSKVYMIHEESYFNCMMQRPYTMVSYLFISEGKLHYTALVTIG